MKTVLPTVSGAALLLMLGPQAIGASAVVVGPPSADPIEQAGIMHSAHALTITTDRQASIIRFHRGARNAISNRADYWSVNRAPPVPLHVEWNGRAATVMPGRCLRINAPAALVAPAAPMQSDTILQGM
jgi:hypothetical protein